MHKNNFDFLRLLFAIFVIISHAKPLATMESGDPLSVLTNDQVLLSYIGVRGFFIISGYLIFQSLLRSKNLVDYFWKRLLRLFPALIVVLAITVLLGPLFYDTAVGGSSYWNNHAVWSYFPRNLSLLLPQFSIPGFFTHNPKENTINGSLWTIGYEFACYMVLGILIVVRKSLPVVKILLVAVWITLFVAFRFFFEQFKDLNFFLTGTDFIELGIYFVGGAILAAFKVERFRHLGKAALACAVVLAISLWAGMFNSGFHFAFLPLLVIGLGAQSTPYLNAIGEKIGDLSYGVYLYSFPVMQALVFFFHFGPLALFLASTILSMAFGYASWHLVEKRALRLKKYTPFAGLLGKLSGKNAAQ